jgi:hypothetical protein
MTGRRTAMFVMCLRCSPRPSRPTYPLGDQFSSLTQLLWAKRAKVPVRYTSSQILGGRLRCKDFWASGNNPRGRA